MVGGLRSVRVLPEQQSTLASQAAFCAVRITGHAPDKKAACRPADPLQLGHQVFELEEMDYSGGEHGGDGSVTKRPALVRVGLGQPDP
jgi:hypothetical protein